MKKPARRLLAGLALAPVLLSSAWLVDDLSYGPQPGVTSTKAFRIEIDLDLEEMSLEVNGQDLSDQASNVEMVMKTATTLEVTDHYEALADGRPGKLKRTFDEIGTSSHVAVSNPMVGEKETDIPAKSELEGTTVLFSWNDSEGEFDVAFADGAEGDEELLEGLIEDMDLRGFLPQEEISAGDTWQVPVEAIRNVMRPGGDLKLEPESDEENVTGMGDFTADDLIDTLEGEFTAEYAGTREEDGLRVGVVKLIVEARCADDLGDKAEAMREKMAESMPPGMQVDISGFDGELDYDAEGELLWNLESGLPHALSLSGEVRLIIDLALDLESPDGTQSMEQSMTFAGTQTITLTTGE